MTKPKLKGTVRLIESRSRCHGVNEKLVVTLLRDGTLKIREHATTADFFPSSGLTAPLLLSKVQAMPASVAEAMFTMKATRTSANTKIAPNMSVMPLPEGCCARRVLADGEHR